MFIKVKKQKKQKIVFYFGNEYFEKYKDRIQVIEGDIVERNFKLSKENYELISKNITTVINAGALVKHFGKSELFNKINEIIDKNKELEEERQIVGMPVRNKRDGRIGIVLHQWKSGSVAVLESINPRVINTHDSWNTLEIVTDEVKQYYERKVENE